MMLIDMGIDILSFRLLFLENNSTNVATKDAKIAAKKNVRFCSYIYVITTLKAHDVAKNAALPSILFSLIL